MRTDKELALNWALDFLFNLEEIIDDIRRALRSKDNGSNLYAFMYCHCLRDFLEEEIQDRVQMTHENTSEKIKKMEMN